MTNADRTPAVYIFTDRQAQLMRQTVNKTIGQTVRGPTNISAAKALEAAGLVTTRELERSGPGLILVATPKGREAWYNFGLRAAGRQPVCLS